MPTISTGQITIVDNNDAKTLVAGISASLGTQQNYVKDDTLETFGPNYATTSNVLTPSITISSPTGPRSVIELQLSQLSAVSWSTSPTGTPNIVSSGALTGSSTDYAYNASTLALSLKTNKLTKASPSLTFYFTANHSDPLTSLVSQVLAQITIGLVVTGTNALYVVVEGPDTIPVSDTSTRNNITLTARLMRGATEETSLAAGNAAYKWHKIVNGTAVELNSGHADWSATAAQQKFRLQDAAGTAITPPASGYHTGKKLIVFEDAINGVQGYRVDVLDDESTSPYSKYFTITDKGDPYQTTIMATGGDKLQNGQGSKTLSLSITKNGQIFTPSAEWAYSWRFADSQGRPAAFVNAIKLFSSTCQLLAHAAYSGATATLVLKVPVGASIPALAANDIVKLIASNGVPAYYKVNTAVSAISNASTETNQNIVIKQFSTDWPITGISANRFQNGLIFVCTQNPTGATLVVTGDDIDGQGSISVNVIKPDYTS